jgi:hypothetical protein
MDALVVSKSNLQSRQKRRPKRRSVNGGRRLPEAIDRSQFAPPVSVSFPPNCIGFPDRLTTILKYVEVNTHTGSATPSAQAWACNSAYDPNFSGSGHQPSFFDNFSAIYGRYFVRTFKVELEITNTLATTAVEAVCVYSDVSVTGSTVDQISESKYSKWCTVGLSTSGTSVRRITMPWMSSAKLMGQPFTEADDNMYSDIGSGPIDTAFCITKLAAVDGITTMTAIVKTSIFMEVVFKDLTPFRASIDKSSKARVLARPETLKTAKAELSSPLSEEDFAPEYGRGVKPQRKRQ